MPIGNLGKGLPDTGDEERDGRRAGKVTTRADEAVDNCNLGRQAGEAGFS